MRKSDLLACTLTTALAIATAADAAAGYRVADSWALGGEGKWDYPSLDASAQKLYLSRGTHVMVVDAQTGKLAGDIADTPGVHGIALAPDLGRGFISMGKADQVKVFDLKTLAILATVQTGAKPDSIVYEPATHAVFAFNGHSNNATVIDAKNLSVIATIALGGGPEFSRADGAGAVYVNIENTNELVALDARQRKVTARWPLPGCEEPSGLAFDAAHRRSFSVCANAKMAILDVTSGRSLATLPIGKGVDGAEFDPETQNAFSANGEGTLTVVHEDDPEHFSVAQSLNTARGARTIVLDARSHRLYLPTARFEGGAPGPADEPKGTPVTGSFFVLVIDREGSKR